jgi:hypothetical protein
MIPSCLFCHTEMIVEKRVKLKDAKKVSPHAKSSRTRYSCETCDYKTTIFATGVRDLIGEQMQVEDELKKIKAQETAARQ